MVAHSIKNLKAVALTGYYLKVMNRAIEREMMRWSTQHSPDFLDSA